MSMLSQIKMDGSSRLGKHVVALIRSATFVLAACDGANQGVQIGNGQAPDPSGCGFSDCVYQGTSTCRRPG